MSIFSSAFQKRSLKSPQLKQALPSKKPLFTIFNRKTYIVLIIVALVGLGLLSQRSFLSDQMSRNPLSAQFSDKNPVDLEKTNLESKFSSTDNSSQSSDLYVGPVRLKGSSYFVDQLDELNSEIKDDQELQASDKKTDDVNLQDFFSHPIDTIVQVNSALKASWLNEGRRTTLIKLVDSVSRYYLAYNNFPVSADPQDMQYGWVEEMRDKRELSGVYQYVLETTYPVAYCGAVNQTGYCYKTDGQNAIIYVRLEKSLGKEMVCDENGVFFLWSSEDNKLGAVCLDGEPMNLGGFTYFKF